MASRLPHSKTHPILVVASGEDKGSSCRPGFELIDRLRGAIAPAADLVAAVS